MHDQHEAGQEQELRWLVKRLGAVDTSGSIDELRAKAESAIRTLESRGADLDRLNGALEGIEFIVTTHLGRR